MSAWSPDRIQDPEFGNFLPPGGVCNGVADLVASPWPLAEEDAELLSAVRTGSEEAFDRLVSRYHASVYNLVYRIVGDSGDAADTVQEVFLKVHRGLGRFQGQSSLKTWIFRIAVHEGCNYRRWWRRHRSREVSLQDAVLGGLGGNDGTSPKLGEMLAAEEPSPFDELASKETARAVDRALSRIPEAYRTAVILRDLEEFSYEEIAEILQVSLGTVKSRVARGREALRVLLRTVLVGELVAAGRGEKR
jgi:RNA polymerase sigma-70 factor (ECF subfamily)